MKNKERLLTKAEKKRQELFFKKSEELEKQGYTPKKLTFNIKILNVFSLILTVVYMAVCIMIYATVNRGDEKFYELGFGELLIFLVAMAILTVLHEGIHGLTWGIFAEQHFKDIEFGFIKEYVTPYCYCRSPLKKYQYIIGSLMPMILLGVIPSIVAICLNSNVVLFLSCVMFGSAGGDIMVTIKIILNKVNASTVLYCDHPTEPGLFVFEK